MFQLQNSPQFHAITFPCNERTFSLFRHMSLRWQGACPVFLEQAYTCFSELAGTIFQEKSSLYTIDFPAWQVFTLVCHSELIQECILNSNSITNFELR